MRKFLPLAMLVSLSAEAAFPINRAGGDRAGRARLWDARGFPHLSIAERAQALREGPASLSELSSLGEAALKADRLDLVFELARGRQVSAWPASLRTALAGYYLKQGELAQARAALPETAARFLDAGAAYRAALIRSGVEAAGGRLEVAAAALAPYLEMRGTFDPGLLRLQRARLFYELRRNDLALEELMHLKRSSPSWYPGVFLGAWAAYRVGDLNLALGSLLSLHSPYLSRKFNPESYVLEAAALFRLCYYESARHSITLLQKHYQSLNAKIDEFRRQYAGRSDGLTALFAAAARATDEGQLGGSDVEQRVLDGVLMSDGLTEASRALEIVRVEEKFLAAESGRWPVALYRRELAAAKREAFRRGQRALLRRLDDMRATTKEALESALAIKLEIDTRQRERLMELGRLPRPKEVDFEAEIKKGYEFWPFQGEFWRDEVGSYVYATTSMCGAGEGGG